MRAAIAALVVCIIIKRNDQKQAKMVLTDLWSNALPPVMMKTVNFYLPYREYLPEFKTIHIFPSL